MSPLTIDFGQGNQLENKGKVREIRILKLVATLLENMKLGYVEKDMAPEIGIGNDVIPLVVSYVFLYVVFRVLA